MNDEKDTPHTPMVHEPVASYALKPNRSRDWSEEELGELQRRNQAAIELLHSWLEGNERDEQDQRETFNILRKALGEDRPSYRKLF